MFLVLVSTTAESNNYILNSITIEYMAFAPLTFDFQTTENKFKRRIQDPLYGYIFVTSLENDIIDTQAFQRLDRLYQTPIVRQVYPNATHTRKSHSLGVMHLYHGAHYGLLRRQTIMREIPDLFSNSFSSTSVYLDNLDISGRDGGREFVRRHQIGRLMAMLHDVGHGPFSHLFEAACNEISSTDKTFGFNHERMSAEIIKTKFDDILVDDITSGDILDVFEKSKKSLLYMKDILDGPFDVDKIDYINRDAYFCGAKDNGRVDYQRIIDGYRVKGGKLLLSSSSVESLMNAFSSLQSMYTNVYYHKTCRSFDFMIIDALKIIPELMKEVALNIDTFLEMDDHSFLHEIKTQSKNNPTDTKLGESWAILQDYLNRKKRYTPILRNQINVADLTSSIEDRLSIFKNIENEYENIHLKIDYSTKAKGVRLSYTDALEWLTGPNILDEENNYVPQSIIDCFPTYYNTLRRYSILVNAFVKTDCMKMKENTVNRARLDITNAINSINKLI